MSLRGKTYYNIRTFGDVSFRLHVMFQNLITAVLRTLSIEMYHKYNSIDYQLCSL